MVAFCHDIGYTPFTHATERLLRVGETHETLASRLIEEEIGKILNTMELSIKNIVKLETWEPTAWPRLNRSWPAPISRPEAATNGHVDIIPHGGRSASTTCPATVALRVFN